MRKAHYLDQLRAGRPPHIALFGLRRIGKTLLLKELMARLLAEGDERWAVEVKWRNRRADYNDLTRFYAKALDLDARSWFITKIGLTPSAQTYSREGHSGEHRTGTAGPGRTAGSSLRWMKRRKAK